MDRDFVRNLNANGVNTILVAISADSDPTHGWKGFSFDGGTPTQPALANNTNDQPRLGVDENGIYIAAQMSNSANRSLNSTDNLYCIPKADLLWGSSSSLTAPTGNDLAIFSVPKPGSVTESFGTEQLNPTVDFSNKAASAPEAMVSRENLSNNSVVVRTRKVTWTGTDNKTAVFNAASYTDTLLGVQYADPINAAQPGGNPLFPSYGQIINSDVVNSNVYLVMGGYSATSGTDIALWAELNASNASLVQSGALSLANVNFIMPSIGVDASGDVGIGMTGVGANQSASVYAAGRLSTDPLNSMSSLVQVVAGSGYIADGSNAYPQRFGDYSITWADTTAGNEFWTLQEYSTGAGASATSTTGSRNNALTEWGAFTIGSPTLSAPANFVGTPQSANVIALSWNAVQGNTTGYTIQHSTDGTNFTNVGSTLSNTTYTYSSAGDGSINYFRVYNTGLPAAFAQSQPIDTPTTAFVPFTVVDGAVLQAENFDNGVNGVAYSTTNTSNGGHQYRTYANQDIGIENALNDTTNGTTVGPGNVDTHAYYDVGYIATGDWLKYTVSVANSGYYNISFRVAAANAAALDLQDLTSNGVVDLTPGLAIPAAAGYQDWHTYTVPSVYLASGPHLFKLNLTAGYNINYIRFDGVSTPYPGSAFTVNDGSVLFAENFDAGANQFAYYDTTSGNSGGAYRSTDVDLEVSPDSDIATNDIGFIANNEWVKYTINVAVGGTYNITLRTASPSSSSAMVQLSDELGNLTVTPTPLNNSGDYHSTWIDNVISGVTLSAGTHVLKILAVNAGYNLNYIGFQLVGGNANKVFTASPSSTAITIKHGTDSTSNMVLVSDGTQTSEYSLASVSNLTISSGSQTESVIVDQSHGALALPGALVFQGGVISLGALVASNLTIEASGGANLTFTGAETLAGLILDSGTTATLTANGVTNLTLGSLTLFGGNQTSARLDLGNNSVTIANVSSSGLTTFQNVIAIGRTSNPSTLWNGTQGIMSSAAHTLDAGFQNKEIRAVGYKITGNLTAPGTMTIGYAYSGDANLDGKVDLNDLNIVLNNLGVTTNRWDQGNLDYTSNGTVNLNDLNDVLNQLGDDPSTYVGTGAVSISIDAGTTSSTLTIVIAGGSTVTFTTTQNLTGLIVDQGGTLGDGLGNSINISGSATLAGTLAFQTIPGVTPGSFSLGDTFTLMSADGGVTGRFDDVVGLPALSTGLHWQIMYAPTTVTAQVFQDLTVGGYVGSTTYRGVSSTIAVAGINDLFGDSDPSAYTISIDWGDGTPIDTTSGGVSWDELTAHDFQAVGTHAYAVAGSYTPTVTVTHVSDGDSITVQSAVDVAAAPFVGISQYSLGSGTHSAMSLTTDANGTLWFIDAATNQLGRLLTNGNVTEFTAPVGFTYIGLVQGSDGNIWATQSNGKVAKIASNGTATVYTVAGSTDALGTPVRGWDGAVWFADVDNNTIDAIATDGSVTSYAIPSASSDPSSLIDNDNPMSMVFVEQDNGSVAVIDYTGNVTEYSASNPTFLTADVDGGVWYTDGSDQLYQLNAGSGTQVNAPIQEMTAASSGGVWFVTSDGMINEVGHAFSDGTVDYYRLTNSSSNLPSIVDGPGGAWFILDDASGNGGNSVVGTVSSNGAISEFTIPATVALQNLTVSSDGSLWASDAGTNLITRIVAPAAMAHSVIHGHSLTATLASFSDFFHPSAVTGSYTVSVNWGDGTTTAGSVIASADPNYAFQVQGTHTYAAAGTFTTTVTITEADGTTTMLSSWVHVF